MDVLRKQLVVVEAFVAKAAPKDKAVLSQKLELLRAKIAEMEEQREARLDEVRARNDRASSQLQELSDQFAARHEGYGNIGSVETSEPAVECVLERRPSWADMDDEEDVAEFKFECVKLERRPSEASTEASDEDVAAPDRKSVV